MHAEPPPGQPETEHLAYALPEQPPAPEPPTAGEWAIGIVFVLAALAIVAGIAWAILGLAA